jgi:formylglycine-generating enzyme required for sulfatase activity
MDGQGPEPVGRNPGISPFGAYDMAGNVRKWCWNKAPTSGLSSAAPGMMWIINPIKRGSYRLLTAQPKMGSGVQSTQIEIESQNIYFRMFH